MIGPGFAGLLTSDSTRIRLVSIVDIAPTARAGGRARVAAGRRHHALRELDDRIDENNGVRLPATILVCALVLALALSRPPPRFPRWPPRSSRTSCLASPTSRTSGR